MSYPYFEVIFESNRLSVKGIIAKYNQNQNSYVSLSYCFIIIIVIIWLWRLAVEATGSRVASFPFLHLALESASERERGKVAVRTSSRATRRCRWLGQRGWSEAKWSEGRESHGWRLAVTLLNSAGTRGPAQRVNVERSLTPRLARARASSYRVFLREDVILSSADTRYVSAAPWYFDVAPALILRAVSAFDFPRFDFWSTTTGSPSRLNWNAWNSSNFSFPSILDSRKLADVHRICRMMSDPLRVTRRVSMNSLIEWNCPSSRC